MFLKNLTHTFNEYVFSNKDLYTVPLRVRPTDKITRERNMEKDMRVYLCFGRDRWMEGGRLGDKWIDRLREITLYLTHTHIYLFYIFMWRV